MQITTYRRPWHQTTRAALLPYLAALAALAGMAQYLAR